MENQIIKQQQNETDLIASVRKKLSELTSENLTKAEKDGSKIVSKKALELRDKFQATTLLASFNTDLQDVICGACRTIDQCERIKSPTISLLEEAYPTEYFSDGTIGESAAMSFMTAHLIVVSDFVGAREKITEFQLRAVGEQIVSMYPTLTMVEFILFCSRLRAGRYGSFYGSVDTQQILKSFEKFLAERERDYKVKEEREQEEKKEREKEMARKNAMSGEDLKKAMDEGKLPNIKRLLERNHSGFIGKISNVLKNIAK